jgi:hypothetical protein
MHPAGSACCATSNIVQRTEIRPSCHYQTRAPRGPKNQCGKNKSSLTLVQVFSSTLHVRICKFLHVPRAKLALSTPKATKSPEHKASPGVPNS